jgi:hypothetical protein
MFRCLTRRLDRLERREPVRLTAPGEQRPSEQPQDQQPPSEVSGDACPVAENSGEEGPISVEFGENTWQI